MNDVTLFFAARIDPSPSDAAGQPLHDGRDEGEEKEEKKEEQTAEQEAEAKAAGDWRREQELESSDWPRERVCLTHERAIPIQETVEALDIREEGEWKRTQERG